ncbi:MAG: hypothetical protein A4E32_01461 [Methanomassiliicoccales archaeon PtaU1.Bin124]|nr:MAG: hypothetical protein A4E32_01461 [Methanomassiliicoccales archaeon PtaU1.Bin124]
MVECRSCGRDIAGDMMFCPYCGTKRAVDAQGKPVDEPAEKVLGIIPFVSGEERLEGDWTIMVTDKRLIFAFWAQGHGPRLKTPGLLVFARPDPESGGGASYAIRYQEMGPDEVQKEDPKNFYIFLMDVQQLRLGHKDEERYDVTLTVNGEAMKFSMPMQHDYRNLLMGQLKDRTVW